VSWVAAQMSTQCGDTGAEPRGDDGPVNLEMVRTASRMCVLVVTVLTITRILGWCQVPARGARSAHASPITKFYTRDHHS